MDRKVKIVEVAGYCPVYGEVDFFLLKEGFILDARESPAVEMYSLVSHLPYCIPLRHGVFTGGTGIGAQRKACPDSIFRSVHDTGSTVRMEMIRRRALE